ncbi:predicted protein [Lichtheimia corymbifera JMRC:FSU:9682]|uniref:Uncharacterized protein n=1 Tax=Lichtheimia corymbifera JMRC:FSU:9682 TaxID=1263082 RepID=A0A068S551_9FUNG|nr:predicted protein [Lichtheimia corymbifera JMRC:FSU:9682]
MSTYGRWVSWLGLADQRHVSASQAYCWAIENNVLPIMRVLQQAIVAYSSPALGAIDEDAKSGCITSDDST